MINFWIAVVVSLVAAIVYIWQSVSTQIEYEHGDSEQETNPSNGSLAKIIVIFSVVLLFVPIGYLWLGNLDKQTQWQNAQQQFAKIKTGELQPEENSSIQELVLSLRTAVDKDPNNGQLWFMLAEVYFQLQMTDLADAALTRALRIEMRPDWLVANAQVVTARGEEADIARAEYLLRQAVQIQPDHQSALLTLGFVQLRQGKFNLAIINWERLKQTLLKEGNDISRIQKQIDFAKRELLKKTQQ
jgi:cytochrome c-type biogenesis protein CcmH